MLFFFHYSLADLLVPHTGIDQIFAYITKKMFLQVLIEKIEKKKHSTMYMDSLSNNQLVCSL
jgi:hypothetical protein